MSDLAQSYLASINAEQLQQLNRYYQIKIGHTMRDAIKENGITDPIVAQFLPQSAELNINDDELADPIGDGVHMPVQGLIHRYSNRVLWTVTPTCAVYCRFCFRKEMIGRKGHAMRADERDKALAYIKAHHEIDEVIFSGGDPLTLTNTALSRLISEIDSIEHVQRIRIHTRIPVVEPSRIDAELCQILANSRKAKYIVLHVNHSQEFGEQARLALVALRDAGVMLFSQTVLLRGINDNVEVLTTLMNTFLAHNVTPYYLHHLDMAKGTQHFRVSLEDGLKLESALRARLSGIAMPMYIVEIPGGEGKIPVNTLTVEQKAYLKQLGIY